MQSLEIVFVGQFHQPAEFRFDRAEGRSIQRLFSDWGSKRDSSDGKSRGGQSDKNRLVHVECFLRLARVMTTPVAFRNWHELRTSIGRKRHQDVLACTFA